MSIVSAIVLYAITWFMTLLVVLPFRLQTQGEAGDVVPGTHASAPENLNMRKKAWITTIIAAVLWAIMVAVILSGWISVRDLDWANRMNG